MGKGGWRQGRNQHLGGQPDRPRASRGDNTRRQRGRSSGKPMGSLDGDLGCCPRIYICDVPGTHPSQ